MRRVGIGIELVCDPPIMLLDEPTSALDAVNTRLVAAALKDLAHRGVLVLASLHQPRHLVYEMLDRLLLLRRGELIYGGPREHATRYFEQLGYFNDTGQNPADFFIEVAFGYELTKKKLRELPYCFGLRANEATRTFSTADDRRQGSEFGEDQETPPLAWDADVSAEKLGLLWRNWFRTALTSMNLLTTVLAKRQSNERRFALAILQCAQKIERKFRAAKKQSRRRRKSEAGKSGLQAFCSFRRGASPSFRPGSKLPQSGGSQASQSRRNSCLALFSPRPSGRDGSPDTVSSTNGQASQSPPARPHPEQAPWTASAAGDSSITVVEVQVDTASGFACLSTPSETRRIVEGRAKSQPTTTPTPSEAPGTEIRDGVPLILSHTMTSGGKTTSTSSSEATPSAAVHPVDVRIDIPSAGRSTPVSSHFETPCESPLASPRTVGDPTPVSSAAGSLTPSAEESMRQEDNPSNSSNPSSSGRLPPGTPRRSTSVAHMCGGTRESELESVSSRVRIAIQAVGVTREQFKAWFLTMNEGFGDMLRPDLANDVWNRAHHVAMQESLAAEGRRRWQVLVGFSVFSAAQEAQEVLPTWTQLRASMYSWPMPDYGEKPGWITHFVVCIQRYLYKLLRTRLRIYFMLLVTAGLGTLCGVLHGADPGINDCLIFYLLFNTMFASICASSSIGTFGGDEDFFSHEAASGVRQMAEGLARLIVDVLPLAALAPVFALPLYAFATLHCDIIPVYILFAWALSPLGNIFSLVARNNATVLTSSVTFVLCAFMNGFFGIKRSALPENMRWLLCLSPGYPALLMMAFGAALAEPLSTKRWAIVRQLQFAKLVPMFNDTDEVAEFGEDPTEPGRHQWREDAMLNLFIIGLVLRLLTLALFYKRSTFKLGGWTYRLRSAVRMRLCRRGDSRRGRHGLPTQEAKDGQRARVTLGMRIRNGSPLAAVLASPGTKRRHRTPLSPTAACTPAPVCNLALESSATLAPVDPSHSSRGSRNSRSSSRRGSKLFRSLRSSGGAPSAEGTASHAASAPAGDGVARHRAATSPAVRNATESSTASGDRHRAQRCLDEWRQPCSLRPGALDAVLATPPTSRRHSLEVPSTPIEVGRKDRAKTVGDLSQGKQARCQRLMSDKI